jgi:N-acetylglucosamine-6-phosphate deacetylase
MVLRSERIVTPSGTVAGEVAIEDGRIAAVSEGNGQHRDALDVGQQWLVPGYIDTHVHGGGGAQCNTADPDEIGSVASFHAEHGTTALLATTVAAPLAQLTDALGAIAHCVSTRRGATVLGAHLEGPFLSPAQPGAMEPAMFTPPDRSALERLLAAGAGTVRMMTLAPELPGALELVQLLVGEGVAPSLGHSDASYDETLAAVRAGARAATHLFNGMGPFHHRDPGVIGAALDMPEVSCELICDGTHLAPAAVRLTYRAKGNTGVRLVTDAMQAAGMPDGQYRLGAATVEVRDGVATLAGGRSIAGSTLTMDLAVRNAVRFLGISVPEAVTLASANPARLLGLDDRKGAIAAGMDADLLVLGEDLLCRATMVGGTWVSGPPDDA